MQNQTIVKQHSNTPTETVPHETKKKSSWFSNIRRLFFSNSYRVHPKMEDHPNPVAGKKPTCETESDIEQKHRQERADELAKLFLGLSPNAENALELEKQHRHEIAMEAATILIRKKSKVTHIDGIKLFGQNSHKPTVNLNELKDNPDSPSNTISLNDTNKFGKVTPTPR